MTNRRTFILSLMAGAVASRVTANLSPSSPITSLAGKRPNIILIMTDDQGMGDLSCYGNKVIKTPHLDALKLSGLAFADFQVSPTCSPTRSAIMTGSHEFASGITHTIFERERLALGKKLLPEVLTETGYDTGIFGKWHLGDEDAYQPGKRGFNYSFIHGAGGAGQNYPGSCADSPPNAKKKYFDLVFRENGTFVSTQGFCTDVIFESALRWIDKAKEDKEPFFAYIAPNAPHGPMFAPEVNKKVFLDMGYDDHTAARFGMIENIDMNVGRFIRQIDDWGLAKDTLLIFMTDNGMAYLHGRKNGKSIRSFNAGFRTGKGTPYEGGTHVPFFMRWPDVLPANTETKALSAHIDLLPTFAALAGAKSIPPVEGRSLLPLMVDPEAKMPDRFLFTHLGRWPVGKEPTDYKFKQCAVRTQRFRLVNNKQLFDIKNDPYEKKNVIKDFPKEVAEMRKAYDQWWTNVRPLMVNENAKKSPHQPYPDAYNAQVKAGGIPTWPAPSK